MVEWKKLGEVCADIIVPMRDRPKVFDGTIPWCRIEDIEGMYFNTSQSGLMVSDKVINKMNLKVFPTGTVICSCSATLGVCAINTRPLITNQTFIGLVWEKILNRFLYYYMLTRKKELLSLSTTGTIPYVSRAKFETMLIPIPSLSEQQRIVSILDTFTSSISNLKQQIEERRKQYEYERDLLLDLEGKEGVEMKKLGDVCKLERGVRVVKKDLQEEGIIPVYQNSLTPLGYYDKSNYPENTTFVICAGAAGEVGFSNKAFWAADDCTCVVCPDFIHGKFIFHYLISNQRLLKSQVRKASVPRLSKDVIGKLIVPFPSLEAQSRIVSILDTFEQSIANLEEQLAMREKQYEYYRNQLLTFE